MSSPGFEPLPPETGTRDFRTTHWSVVLLAGATETERSAAALEKLCRTYWYPVYAFVRSRGYDPHTAQDLTQGFFARLLEKRELTKADKDHGRFRTFLLSGLSYFLANEWDRAQRLKRGGGQQIFSIDEAAAEQRFQYEPPDERTPEKNYDRRWAETMIEGVLVQLEKELGAGEQSERFEVLKMFLLEDKGTVSYEDAAQQLSVSLGAVKSIIRRMRLRFGELMRAEIANTVSSPEQVDEEIQHLLQALSD